MTRADFEPYARDLADRMGLKDWAIAIIRGQPDNEDTASIECVFGRKIANVKLSDDFLEESTPEEQRQTLCHELAHALFMPMHLFLRDELDGSAYKAYHLLMEYGIDGVADAIAPHMPLPLKVKKADQ